MMPFSIVCAAYAFLLRLVPAFIVVPVMITNEETLSQIDATWFVALVVAPIIETLVFQWFPIGVMSRLTSRSWLVLGTSAVLFSSAHHDSGLLSMLIAVPSGIALAWAFLVQRDRGVWRALSTTALVHMWVNLVAMTIGLITD